MPIVSDPDPNKSYAPVRSYTRTADQYLAIGVDANQISDQLLVSRRAVVNAAEIAHANNLQGAATNDAETGGLLALAVATYFHDADQGEKSIAGLTGAVRDFTFVASGVATCSSATPVAVPDTRVQFPYQPKGMGIDVPENYWSAISINSNDPQSLNRYTLLGYQNSSMEGLVWEELTNYKSISTIKAFQLANQISGNTFKTITANSGNQGAPLTEPYLANTLLPNLTVTGVGAPYDNYGPIIDDIWARIQGGFSVYVPTNQITIGQNNPQGPWAGSGYMLIDSAGNTQGYVINGKVGTVWQPAHGGGGYDNFFNFTVSPTNAFQLNLSDPINSANGEVIRDDTDFSIPNLGAPLGMTRHYHSFNTTAPGQNALPDRGMGDGWSFSYSDTIAPPISGVDYQMGQAPPAGSVVWFTDTGLRLYFAPIYNAQQTQVIGYTTPNSVYGTLTATMIGSTATSYTWTDKTGEQIVFNQHTSDGAWHVTQINDRYTQTIGGTTTHINGVTIAYDDGSSHITFVRELQNPARYLQFSYSNNHVATVSDFTGRTWRYYYDASGRLQYVINADDPNATPSAGSSADAKYTTAYGYVDATANSSSALHDLLQWVKDPNASAATVPYYTAQFSYYANRRGFQVTDAVGNVVSFSFNLFRNRTGQTDARGLTTYFDYDSDGNILQQLNPDRTTLTNTYLYVNSGTVNTDLVSYDTDEFGQKEFFAYADQNNSTNNIGGVNGNLTSFTDRLNTTGAGDAARTTTTVYTDNSNVFTVTRGADQAETQYFYYTKDGTQNSSRQQNGADVSLWKTVDALGDVTTYLYPGVTGGPAGTNRGEPSSMTAPDGNLSGATGYVTSYAYNAAGQTVSVTSQVSSSPSNQYTKTYSNYDSTDGSRGFLTSVTDGRAPADYDSYHTTTYTNIDPLGRVGTETQPDPDGPFGSLTAPITAFVYDPNGNLLSSTLQSAYPVALTTSASYDGLNRAIKSVTADGTYTTAEFDPAGNLVYATDAMGRVTQFVYDSRNRQIAVIGPTVGGAGSAGGTGSAQSASVVRTQYNGGSRVVAATDANGNTSRFFYDALGRKTEEIAPYMSSPKDGATIDDTAGATNGTGTFTETSGSWSTPTGQGGNAGSFSYSTSAGATATWTFTGLPGNATNGQEAFYEVFVTWPTLATAVVTSGQPASADANFTTNDTNGIEHPPAVNEQLAPTPSPLFTDGAWQQLPVLLRSNNGIVIVTLTNGDGNALLADAVRIVQVTPTWYSYEDYDDKSFVTVGGWKPYLAVGGMTWTTDPNHTTETDRDKLGRVTKVIDAAPTAGAAQPTSTYKYDSNGNVVQVTNPRLHSTLYFYDEMNRKIAQVEEDPTKLDPGYSKSTIDTSNDLTTQFFYDADSNLTYVVNAAAGASHWIALNGVLTPDPNYFSDNLSTYAFYTTQFDYDSLNRKDKETDPLLQASGTRPETNWDYDQNGDLDLVTDPNGNFTAYSYNLDHERTQVMDSLANDFGDPAHTTTTMFDAAGNVLSVTSPAPQAGAGSPNPPLPNPQTWFTCDTMNRRLSEIDPLPVEPAGVGAGTGLVAAPPTTTWTYDPNGNVTSTTDALGNVTYTKYNGWNLPVSTTDALGAYNGDPLHTVTTAYDAWGRAVSVTDQLGRTSTIAYDNLGRKVSETAPAATSFVVGSGLQTVTPTTYFSYDLNGNLDFTKDPLLHTTVTYFDGLNRPTVVVDALAGMTAAPTSDLTPATQPAHSTMTVYDKLGNVLSVTVPVNGSTTRTTSYSYDNLSRKLTETDAVPQSGVAHSVTSWSYDAVGNVLSITDPDGHTSYSHPDPLNRVDYTVSALGAGPTDWNDRTTTAYDNAGNVTGVTDPDGNTTSYVHDRLNRQTSETENATYTDSSGVTHNNALVTTQLTYDAAGNVVQKIDKDGRVTKFVYDPLNRQVEEDWMSGTTITHATHTYFDAAGQVVGVSDPAASYQYSYDADGRVTRSRMAPADLSTIVPNTYSGQVVSGQPSGNSPTIDWNGTGTQKPYAYYYPVPFNAGDTVFLTVTSTAFDPVVIAQDPSGNASKWLIDDNSDGGHNAYLQFVVPAGEGGNWLIAVTSPSPTANGAYTFSILDNPNPFVPVALTELDCTFNADGTEHSVSDKSDVSALANKSATTTYSYDALARTTQIQESGDGSTPKQVNYTYFDDGAVHTVTRYDGSPSALVATTTDGYDGMGRLTSLNQVFGATPTTHSYTWQYDVASNIIQAVTPDATQGYTLDNANELTSAIYVGTGTVQANESYSFDANGNRTSGGSLTGAGNRLTFDGKYTYTSDAEGNRTAKFIDVNGDGKLDSGDTDVTQYTWDQRNRLIEVVMESTFGGTGSGNITADVHFAYDFADRLIRRYDSVAGGAKKYTVYDGSNPYLTVSDTQGLANPGTNTTATISQRDLYAAAVDQILATDDDAGNVLWGLADNEGTPRDVVDKNGALATGGHVEFDSYGNPVGGTSILAGYAIGEAGMRYDLTTHLYIADHRIYDALTGRWLSEDPTPLSGTNPTDYVGNSPIGRIDLSGYGATSTLASSYFGSTISDLWSGISTVAGSYLSATGDVLNCASKAAAPGALAEYTARRSAYAALKPYLNGSDTQIPGGVVDDLIARGQTGHYAGLIGTDYHWTVAVPVARDDGSIATATLNYVDPATWYSPASWFEHPYFGLGGMTTDSPANVIAATKADWAQQSQSIMNVRMGLVEAQQAIVWLPAAIEEVGAGVGWLSKLAGGGLTASLAGHASAGIASAATGGQYESPLIHGIASGLQWLGVSQSTAQSAAEFSDGLIASLGTLRGAWTEAFGGPGIRPNVSSLDQEALQSAINEWANVDPAPVAAGRGIQVNPFELTATHELTMSRAEFNALKSNIATNGIQEPVKYLEYNGEKYIVDGHHRVRAAKELGMKTIPAERVELPYKGYTKSADLINQDRR